MGGLLHSGTKARRFVAPAGQGGNTFLMRNVQLYSEPGNPGVILDHVLVLVWAERKSSTLTKRKYPFLGVGCQWPEH
jgi:hypothetical protein